MKLDLEGHAALVTGATGGLGSHFAKTLARAGASVAVAARRPESLHEVRAAIESAGGRAVPIACDVTDPASVARAFDAAAAALGPITVVVNNAGIAITKPLLEHTEEDWRSVMDVNLDGAWRVAQTAARHMVAHQRGGSIVNIASIAGLRAVAQVPSYVASKAALIHLTRAMALELARHRCGVLDHRCGVRCRRRSPRQHAVSALRWRHPAAPRWRSTPSQATVAPFASRNLPGDQS